MTYAPTSAAHRSMANYFPEWTVDNLPERSNSPQCLDPAPGLGDTYSQFLLGSNWILRPDGLKEFYEKLEQHFPVRATSHLQGRELMSGHLDRTMKSSTMPKKDTSVFDARWGRRKGWSP